MTSNCESCDAEIGHRIKCPKMGLIDLNLNPIMVKGQKVYASLSEIITAALEWNPSNLILNFKKVYNLDEEPLYVLKPTTGALNQNLMNKLKVMGFTIIVNE